MMFEDMHQKHMAGTKGHMMSQSEMGKMMAGKMMKLGPNRKKMMKEVRRRKGGKGESDGGGI